MNQIKIPRYGPPEVLALHEAPDPTPREGEVRIAVRAAGVNFADVMARIGLYPDAPKPPLVPGYEVAGVVDAVGRGVTRVCEGDRVVAVTRFGGYSTSAVVPDAFAFVTRANVSAARAPGDVRRLHDRARRAEKLVAAASSASTSRISGVSSKRSQRQVLTFDF